jgi:hypothetical protein
VQKTLALQSCTCVLRWRARMCHTAYMPCVCLRSFSSVSMTCVRAPAECHCGRAQACR